MSPRRYPNVRMLPIRDDWQPQEDTCPACLGTGHVWVEGDAIVGRRGLALTISPRPDWPAEVTLGAPAPPDGASVCPVCGGTGSVEP